MRFVGTSGFAAWALVLICGAAGCASEGTEALTAELNFESARAALGVEKIARGLDVPDLAGRAFGEGVQEVEAASRALGALETNPRANDAQKLLAVLFQARAWDDATRAIEQAPIPARLDPEQSALVANMLIEKAFPARVAARVAYERGLRLACGVSTEDLSLVPELVDGVARYGGAVALPEEACADRLFGR